MHILSVSENNMRKSMSHHNAFDLFKRICNLYKESVILYSLHDYAGNLSQ